MGGCFCSKRYEFLNLYKENETETSHVQRTEWGRFFIIFISKYFELRHTVLFNTQFHTLKRIAKFICKHNLFLVQKKKNLSLK